MIPQVKTWSVRIVETDERVIVFAPTKFLAKLNFRHEFPRHWGKEIKISLAKV